LHQNNKAMILSTCGLKCDECEFYNKTCAGCRNVKGATFWAVDMMPAKVCPLYHCAVKQRGFRDCGECPELPCATFLQMKDPATSDEDHQRMIGVRVSLLRDTAN
jgi:hypothetical protein